MRIRSVLLAIALALVTLLAAEGAAAWAIRNDPGTMLTIAPGANNFVVLSPDTPTSSRPTVGTDLGDVAHWVPGTSFPLLEREDYHRSFIHATPDQSITLESGTYHAPATDHLRVAFIGDTGTTSDAAATLRAIAAQKVDLVVHVGDISYADLDETTWDAWYQLVMTNLPTTPIAYATGNHDTQDWTATSEIELLRGPSAYYSFDLGAVHVIVLDSNNVNDAQAAWLEQDLTNAQASGTKWIVPVEHHPWYSTGTEHGSNLMARETFASHFARHGVKLAVAGHEHNYERSTPTDGITYVVTGGGGAPLYDGFGAKQPWTQTRTATHEFLLVDFTQTSATARAISTDGRALDTFTI